jgi:hypothetical protein
MPVGRFENKTFCLEDFRMVRSIRATFLLPTLLTSLLLAACGGGGGNDNNTALPSTAVIATDPNPPQATGITATDGFTWFNFRRQQMGLSSVVRNSQIDTAAKGHSDYQAVNGITHDQTPGKAGFTGATLPDRLRAANYPLPTQNYAIGEVISMTSDPSGFNAAEGLIAAIYHRFVAFEPMFKEAGVGVSKSGNGATYFTTDFAVAGLVNPVTKARTVGLGAGKMVTYPFANQQLVPANFFSDNEVPDPIASKNEVGYPISVHADGLSDVKVQSFTVQPHGGATLAVQLLTNSSDTEHTPPSAAAIIPLNVLTSATTYDVQFVGTVDNEPVSRSWSFTTR